MTVAGDQAVGKSSWLTFLEKSTFSAPYKMTATPELKVLTVVAEDEDAETAKVRAAAGEPLTRVEFHCLDAPGNEVFYPLSTGDPTVRRGAQARPPVEPLLPLTYLRSGRGAGLVPCRRDRRTHPSVRERRAHPASPLAAVDPGGRGVPRLRRRREGQLHVARHVEAAAVRGGRAAGDGR